MIRWGRIPGLDDADREWVATLARGHRKSASEAKRVIAESALPKDQRAAARRLLALLRLADGSTPATASASRAWWRRGPATRSPSTW
jgi:exopolyphosphatase/pppGpp-phosphohydrolase